MCVPWLISTGLNKIHAITGHSGEFFLEDYLQQFQDNAHVHIEMVASLASFNTPNSFKEVLS
jgi:creatinine amidohydrolase/Fe(II)-dependent formamide hydrolase-like protein